MTRDPWPVLVSEVMLQQTQVARVVPFYERFVARYPAPAVLAEAPAAEALAMWSGLGYNRRAVRLQEAARRITADGWPPDAAGLQTLPGIGPYTAAAVACFAYGDQIPTTDTNLRRVLSRWYGRSLVGRELTEAARAELPLDRAADWNQAVMDLGAGFCRPVGPSCSECPVAIWCAGPETYVPPPAQGRFRGSRREARGAVIRSLVLSGPATLAELHIATDLDKRQVAHAVGTLADEGMVEEFPNGVFRLPGS
jgi:A/G-specific adenine glycosylase